MQDQSQMEQEKLALAQRVRALCVQTALDAYEQGGIAGLCEAGRWDLAVDAMRALDLKQVVEQRMEHRKE